MRTLSHRPKTTQAPKVRGAVAAVVLSSWLSACTTATVYNEPTVESRPVITNSQRNQSCQQPPCAGSAGEPIVEPLDNDIARARYFEEQARLREQADTRINALLNAAEYYIQGNQVQEALRLVMPLRSDPPMAQQFSKRQRDRLDIVIAYADYAAGNCFSALDRLERFDPSWVDPLAEDEGQDIQALAPMQPPSAPSIDPSGEQADPLMPEREFIAQPTLEDAPAMSPQQVDALLLQSFCFRDLRQYDAQINALILRESGLRGEALAQSNRYTWQVINALPELLREQLISITQYPRIRPRLEQSLNGINSDRVQQVTAFSTLPTNASVELNRIEAQWGPESVRQIAVLLPLSSRFGKAAEALLDGIKYAHAKNLSGYAPELLVYDIGDTPSQTGQYYQAAINQGADLVIGPLGKDYADQLTQIVTQYHLQATGTILLGGQELLPPLMTRLTLSPEREGVLIAREAHRRGHLSAAIVASNQTSKQRVQAAFEREWLRLGGRISARMPFSPAQFDHSVELRLLFNAGASELRANRLAEVLGEAPEFNPYQRADIDLIVMLADAQQGRILRPQINFFSGARLPVFAGSDVYSGVPDAINDLDLEKTQFPIMPWVAVSAEISTYAGQLNQLFALGADSYQAASTYAPRSSLWTLAEGAALKGHTGWLSLMPDRSFFQAPLWARFRDGLASVANPKGYDLTPLLPKIEVADELIDEMDPHSPPALDDALQRVR